MENIQNNAEIANLVANAVVAPVAEIADKRMFNFDELFAREAEEEVDLPKEILADRVEIIKAAVKAPFDQAALSFHQRNQGTLYIKLSVGTRKFYRTYWCAADTDLCFAVMCAIRGKHELLDKYSVKDRQPERSDKNLVLEILKDFLKSRLRAKIGKDFVTEEGKTFMRFTMHLTRNCIVKFCVETGDELKALLEAA